MDSNSRTAVVFCSFSRADSDLDRKFFLKYYSDSAYKHILGDLSHVKAKLNLTSALLN